MTSQTTPSEARRLLTAMVTAGTIGFGGGSALIPVMERLTVDRGLLDPSVFTRHVVVANITPGALPVKLGAAAGFNRGGLRLSVAAALLIALPGMLATLLLLAGISALGEAGLTVLNYASVGISAFIIALLAGYVIKVHRQAGRRWPKFLAVTIATAAVMGANTIAAVVGRLIGVPIDLELPQLSALQVIVGSLVLISLAAMIKVKGQTRAVVRAEPQRMRRVWAATAVFGGLVLLGLAGFAAVAGWEGLSFGGLLLLSTVTSFGGGEAYIGVADGFFVQSGLLARGEFYTQLVPIANALPGPILIKVGSGSSYLFGGAFGVWQAWLLGAAGMLVTVGGCCGLAMPILGLYAQVREHPVVVGIGRYILPVICGLLVSVAATMIDVSVGVMEGAGVPTAISAWLMVAASALLTVLHVRRALPDLALLGIAGALSVVALLAM